MTKDGGNSSGLPFALLEAGGAIGAALAIGAFQLVKGQWRRQREQDEQDERDSRQLQGQVVMVTGAEGSIGRQAAKGLALKGARVILACRSSDKCSAVARAIQLEAEGATRRRRRRLGRDTEETKGHKETPASEENSSKVEAFEGAELEMEDMRSVREFAETYAQAGLPLNALVHGASTRFKQREVVLATGGNPALVEKTFASNHLGPWLLTRLLLSVLEETGRRSGQVSRVVFNASTRAQDKLPLLSSLISDPTASSLPCRWSSSSAVATAQLATLLTVHHYRNSSESKRRPVHFYACDTDGDRRAGPLIHCASMLSTVGHPAPWYWRACKGKANVAQDATDEAQASLLSTSVGGQGGQRGQRATSLGTLLWSMAEDMVGLTPHY